MTNPFSVPEFSQEVQDTLTDLADSSVLGKDLSKNLASALFYIDIQNRVVKGLQDRIGDLETANVILKATLDKLLHPDLHPEEPPKP